jgi:hypothetical protein
MLQTFLKQPLANYYCLEPNLNFLLMGRSVAKIV